MKSVDVDISRGTESALGEKLRNININIATNRALSVDDLIEMLKRTSKSINRSSVSV